MVKAKRAKMLKLTIDQHFELRMWLNAKYGDSKKLDAPGQAIAEQVSRELGFEVKRSHIYNSCEYLGIDTHRQPSDKPPKIRDEIAAIQKRVEIIEVASSNGYASLSEGLLAVTKAVNRISSELGLVNNIIPIRVDKQHEQRNATN